MIRKITALLSVLTLIFTSSTAAFAKIESNEFDSEAINVLYALGAFGEMTEDEIEPEGTVSRGEFVSMITNLLGISADLGKQIFSDIENGSPYYDVTQSAYFHRFISGSGDGTFLPDENLTYYDALTVLVRLAGGEQPARANGGYPTGYLSTAQTLHLTKGVQVKDTQELYLYEAAQLLVNTVTGQSYIYEISKKQITLTDRSILADKKEIYKSSGTVTATPYTRLTESVSGLKQSLEIDEVWYKSHNPEYEKYIGQKVDYYYSEQGGDLEILYVAPDKKSKTIEVKASEILTVRDGKLYYTVGNESKERAVRLPKALKVIYNQKAMPDYTEADLLIESGKIVFVSSGSDEYDIAYVTEYHGIVVGGIDLDKGIFASKFEQAQYYDFSDEFIEKISIRNASGETISLKDIKEWDVLQLALSQDKKVVEAILSEDVVETTVDRLEQDGNDLIIHSYMGEFKVADNPYLRDMLKIGVSCYLYLDTEERVIGIKILSAIKGYAWLLKSYLDESDEQTIHFKFLDASNKIITLPADLTKLKIDGSKTSIQEIPSHLFGTGFTRQMVNLTVNNEKITALNTTKGSPKQKDAIIKMVSSGGNYYRYFSSGRNFQGYVTAKADTTVFVVPDQSENEKDYKVSDMSYFKNNERYVVDAYNSNPESVLPSAIVVHLPSGGLEINNHSTTMLVKSITQGIDENDQSCDYLTGFIGTSEQTFAEGEDHVVSAANLQAGDIIKFNTDINGKISKVFKVLDAETKTVTPPPEYYETDYGNLFHMAYGYVYSKEEDVLTLTGAPSSSTAVSQLTFVPRAEAAVFVVDRSRSRGSQVQLSTFEAIKDYKSFGTPKTFAFIGQQYAITQTIVIYEGEE